MKDIWKTLMVFQSVQTLLALPMVFTDTKLYSVERQNDFRQLKLYNLIPPSSSNSSTKGTINIREVDIPNDDYDRLDLDVEGRQDSDSDDQDYQEDEDQVLNESSNNKGLVGDSNENQNFDTNYYDYDDQEQTSHKVTKSDDEHPSTYPVRKQSKKKDYFGSPKVPFPPLPTLSTWPPIHYWNHGTHRRPNG